MVWLLRLLCVFVTAAIDVAEHVCVVCNNWLCSLLLFVCVACGRGRGCRCCWLLLLCREVLLLLLFVIAVVVADV